MSKRKGKLMKDAVHGYISLDPLCVAITNTPQFQRLRYLKQLGVTYFVYPAAAHNRYEHSIGTCYLAGQMVEHLQQEHPDMVSEKDVLCVKVAALCHDLGHGPFSHCWEAFIRAANQDANFCHENMSVHIFEDIYNSMKKTFESEGLKKKDIDFITELIDPRRKDEQEQKESDDPDRKRRNMSFFYEIVSNKRTEVDVDKWDYYLRDSHSLGLKVTFEYERLLDSCRAMEVTRDEKTIEICYRDKDADTLYEMFHTRALLHKKAYQHHTVKVIEQMLIDAFMKADGILSTYQDKNGTAVKLSEIHNNRELFIHLTDDLFNEILRSKNPELEDSRRILGRIQTRKLYKVVANKLLPAAPFSNHESKKRKKEELKEFYKKENDDKGGQWDVLWSEVNYGIEFPKFLEKQWFYNKSGAEEPKAKQIKLEDLSNMLPNCYQDVKLHLISKNGKDHNIGEAKKTFIDKVNEMFPMPTAAMQ
ncbi:deoxynucleoside triphosphate triphosphohydrolase SAMHD1 [Procambarus clarkii]|uniref:deoxynucleoside triphosphate triphosphohydrolase SAMHD1 n=1 Tax=Procambarus clarkii TaxID=6728 RepID=UPI003743004C